LQCLILSELNIKINHFSQTTWCAKYEITLGTGCVS
jgi:hypothetical protein